ncbi:MAG: NAD(P)/FAD-dependent oxidoreductase [Anaerolineales bacterium]|nr:NAD(P)/FAD-dependent oxidoreductase [Anaerolineales bacterium]MDW8226636.1 NAD(P)/FAD-dependent oxidoreductase [Anaerolineales bacterium]
MDYDVVVIGSGAGGLTAAVALAQAGKKVLVLEQHDRPGGWTHSFTLQGYRFSPGVHYIGDLQEGGGLRRIYDGLGVSQDLTFCELNPNGYDHIVIGERRIDFPKGREQLIETLKRHFPHEAEGIDGYFRDMFAMMEGLRALGSLDKPISAAKGLTNLLKWARATGADLLEAHIHDPLLRGVLSGQAGDHGLPPSRVSAFMHAGITYHYLEGAYYPQGGAFALPRAFVRALKRAGGELRLKSRVQRILLEGKRVLGVKLASGEDIRASIVISNADPEVTFGQLIGREALSPRLRRKLDGLTYSTSCLSLFFATDMDLRAAGLDSGNFWYYDHADVDRIYADGLTDALLHQETPPGMFLTVTTLKDPSKMHHHGPTAGHHTCEAFAFVSYDAFVRWAKSQPGARPADYQALKEDLAWRMVRGLEKRIPGLSQRIVFWSLGTPLTNEHYLNATRGNLYGIEKSPSQVGPLGFTARTEFDGLFLCGASTTSHGVAGATSSGLEAAKAVLGCRTEDLLRPGGPGPKFLSSEDPTAWQGVSEVEETLL